MRKRRRCERGRLERLLNLDGWALRSFPRVGAVNRWSLSAVGMWDDRGRRSRVSLAAAGASGDHSRDWCTERASRNHGGNDRSPIPARFPVHMVACHVRWRELLVVHGGEPW